MLPGTLLSSPVVHPAAEGFTTTPAALVSLLLRGPGLAGNASVLLQTNHSHFHSTCRKLPLEDVCFFFFFVKVG